MLRGEGYIERGKQGCRLTSLTCFKQSCCFFSPLQQRRRRGGGGSHRLRRQRGQLLADQSSAWKYKCRQLRQKECRQSSHTGSCLGYRQKAHISCRSPTCPCSSCCSCCSSCCPSAALLQLLPLLVIWPASVCEQEERLSNISNTNCE